LRARCPTAVNLKLFMTILLDREVIQ